MESSSGKEQAQAIWKAITDWNLEERVQIICCDTTASNTGRINGACVLLEQKLDRELLVFACRHHVFELVLKSVFEAKIPNVSTSPDITLFKSFKDNWKTVNPNQVQSGEKLVKKHFKDSEVAELIDFYKSKLLENIIRDDYRELIELSILYLGGDFERKGPKIRPPGAIHRARWMARALYSLYMVSFYYCLS